MFVVFEGVDGAGKSTQLDKCKTWLNEKSRQVTICRDPGSTQLGNRIRNLLLERGELSFCGISEMFLFMAARAQLVSEIVRPAISQGQVVLCDRFLLSTVVYQGHAGELDPHTIWNIGKTATQEIEPDMTLIFDLPVEIAIKRIGSQRDSVEARGEEYLARVRRGFLAEAAGSPNVKIIDATGDPRDIQQQVQAQFECLLNSNTS